MIFNNIKKLDYLLVFINNGHLDVYNNNRIDGVGEKTISKLKDAFTIILYPIKLLFKKDLKFIISDTWLVYQSKNNHKALLPLKDKSKTFINPQKNLVYRYLFFYKILYTIPLIIFLIWENKIKWFLYYFEVLGYFEESKRLLKKYNPTKIVFANDHNPYQISLKLAAKALGIETFYIQHACVAKNLPPLDFTVSFLDGFDALNKYKEIGPIIGEIELIGAIRFDHNKIILNKNKTINTIGIALNAYDKISDTNRLIHKLMTVFLNINIIIRFHPSMKSISIDKKHKVSISHQEEVLDFLGKIDLLIAGDSSIHLEATIMNVVPVYYKITNNQIFDIYEFIKNNLVYNAKTTKDLIEYIKINIKNKTQVTNRIKYYDEYYNSGVDYKKILKKYNL